MGMVRLVQVIQWRRCWGSGRMGLDTTSTSGERCDECCWGLGRMGTGTTRITDWSFLWVFLDGGFMLHLPQGHHGTTQAIHPLLSFELQYWTGVLSWCASVSPTFSPVAVFFSSNSLVDGSLTKNSSNNCWCSSINSFRKEVSSIDLGGGCRG